MLNTHEDLTRVESMERSSDRAFGLVFAVFFLIVGASPLIRGGSLRWVSLGVSGGFLLLALVAPTSLTFANALCTRLAALLNKVVTPVVTGLMFYLVFAPVGILMRLSGKDPLRLRVEAGTKSYWIERRPPGPPPESMAQQF